MKSGLLPVFLHPNTANLDLHIGLRNRVQAQASNCAAPPRVLRDGNQVLMPVSVNGDPKSFACALAFRQASGAPEQLAGILGMLAVRP